MATHETHAHENGTPAYRVTIDKTACDGIFACLTRDPRFVESEDGLATIDPEPAREIYEKDETIIAEFEDDRIEKARKAAAACPPNAITVTRLEEP